VREINMYKGPSVTHYKVEFSPDNLQRCWEQCKLRSDYGARRKAVDQFNQQNRWKKRGISIIPIKYGIAFAESFLNQAGALVHIYKDGSVLVTHGGTDSLFAVCRQVASRELHVPTSKIFISETSTATVPNTCPSAASFGTDANGMAVKVSPVPAVFDVCTREAHLQKISLSATGFFRGKDLYFDWDKMEGEPYSYFTFGVCCSEVELDCLTGDYRIEGAFTQGLGLYTLEELHYSPTGMLYSRGPSQYKIPAVCDMPLQFSVYLLPDSYNPHAIYSSKGIGEPTLFLGSSVFFAIKDAVAAARSDSGLSGPFSLDTPATPEKACLAFASKLNDGVLCPAAPGGTLSDDMTRTEFCLFTAQEDLETMQAYAQVFNKLIRRYKYLEKGFEEEIKKLLLFLKGFTESERNKLAMLTGILLANGSISASILISLYNENLVKEGVSAAFAVKLFKSWIHEKDINSVAGSLRKVGMDNRLMELFPANKRSCEHFSKYFTDAGLKELSDFARNQQSIGARKELQKELQEMMARGDPQKEIIAFTKEEMKKASLSEQALISIIWTSVMSSVEWNKKEELVTEQAIKHLKQYSDLLKAFTSQGLSELSLLLKIQEYCYDNIHFMKAFQKIVVLLYK
ncbi:hypothetical protein GOODEAATRI_014076, partial [Goodea atripinnis]